MGGPLGGDHSSQIILFTEHSLSFLSGRFWPKAGIRAKSPPALVSFLTIFFFKPPFRLVVSESLPVAYGQWRGSPRASYRWIDPLRVDLTLQVFDVVTRHLDLAVQARGKYRARGQDRGKSDKLVADRGGTAGQAGRTLRCSRRTCPFPLRADRT